MSKVHGLFLASLASLFLCGTAHAAPDFILSSRSKAIAPAQRFELSLTVTNSSQSSQRVELSNPLHLKVDTGDATTVIDLVTDESLAPFELAPGSFRTIRLNGELPRMKPGVVTFDLTGIDANKLVLAVEEAAAPAPELVAESSGETATSSPTSDLVDKPPVLALSVYEPVYFLFGHKGGFNAKFQISFKYRLFDDKGAIANRLPWLDDLYLGFSQTSLWDLGERSSPFHDSSYRPRLFYLDDDFMTLFDGRLRIGLEGGFGHESNGKSASDSRSVNILFAKPILTWGDPEARHLYVAPMVFKYLERSDNPDIADYRGHTELLVGYGSKGELNAWTTIRKGKKSTYASMEFNLSYPLARLSNGGLSGWLMFQYFNGYGESLLDYNERLNSQFRLGLAIAL